MTRFLDENFAGHLERWSPPAAAEFFTERYWAARLAASVDDYHADRGVRFVLQPGDAQLDGAILGTCSYTNIVRGAFHACHLGYQVALEHQGLGLMAEALRAANDYMFRQVRMHRLMANYRPENERSRRLLERLGFVREGLAKDYLFIDGAWRDHVLTALVNPAYRDAWMAQPAARY